MVYRILKRSIDILGGLAGIAITALLTLPIAIAIKLDSTGPVFYAQERIGKDEKPFRIHKFRTMVLDADAQGHKPTVDDERVTCAWAVSCGAAASTSCRSFGMYCAGP